MGIDFFVTKLRNAVVKTDALVGRSRGNYHLLSASLRSSYPGNPRIENLIIILGNSLERAIASAERGLEPDLEKILTVLDAIEFHRERFIVPAR